MPKSKIFSAFAPDRTIHRIQVLSKVGVALFLGSVIGIGGYLVYNNIQSQTALTVSQGQVATLEENLKVTQQKLAETQQMLAELEAVDQKVRNDELQAEIADLQKGFRDASGAYEELLNLVDTSEKKSTLSAQLTSSLLLLSQRKYDEAIAKIAALRSAIKAENDRLAALAPAIAANLPKSNTPPGSGSTRQVVESDAGSFQVDLIAADLNSTRVVVETASNETCTNNCPVASLADYVSRAGGFAGINGPYFCPAEYPSCAGKTNSFDTLLMNRNKVYFNSDNNVYSSVPAFIFSGSSVRVVGASSEWGRDTGVDSVIASQPLLLSNGEVRFGGDGDPKKGSRGSRAFIATRGSMVYIGVVRSATVAEVARVLKALGMDHGLNLDSGGSTALINGGRYLAGPGRQTPFGIVLVRK